MKLTHFSDLSSPARQVWAKSGESSGHGLLAHMLDVAAVTETLLSFEPTSTRRWAADAFGLPEAQVMRWLAAVAGLHDFGKAIPGFQNKWPEGMARVQAQGLTFTPRSLSATQHDRATAVLLGELLYPQSQAEMQWVRHVLQAISAHHGYNFLETDLRDARPGGEGKEWRAARQEIFAAYWAVLSPQGVPAREALSTPAVEWLAGLTSVADWIGSNPEWFPQGERQDDLQTYAAQAKELAERALQSIGWNRFQPLLSGSAPTEVLLGRVTGQVQALAPRPLQVEGEHLLADVQGPALLLVEAPMGEGKTELAFLAHLRLQAANRHRGLYVALPTQATGNALFKRALTFLQQFAGDTTLDMQLVHGGVGLNEDVRHLRDINHSKAESVTASAWFSQRRRPLLSPYGVGTIDQALFATLNVKHHFVRLWGLSNRVVVLDEVHAYDTYTTGLIEALIRWLKSLGSSVILMSATLPRATRDALCRAWQLPSTEVPELPYPRLLLADDRGVSGATFASRVLPPVRLQALDESPEHLAQHAQELLEQGGCGAVIVNTVDRAQTLYRMLKERLGKDARLMLFHARYPADCRSEREREVLACFGKEGERPAKALLIATQVVEQSLDIDFDFMLSDLAPVDLLLQRAGRLHRHERERPAAHAEARLFVAGLQPHRPPELKDTAWQYVYDAYILGRTWALLSRESILQLPQDIDRLVQAVYSQDELPDGLEQQALDFIEVESYGAYRARVNSERQQALNVSIDPAGEPQSAYASKPRGNEEGEGLGLINRTRLGEEGVALVPVHVRGDGWSLTPDGPVFSPDAPIGDGIARQLLARQLRLSRKAVVRHFASKALPAAFAEHPLLQHLVPLPLEDSGCAIGPGLTLRLDDELGMVYDNNNAVTREDDA